MGGDDCDVALAARHCLPKKTVAPASRGSDSASAEFSERCRGCRGGRFPTMDKVISAFARIRSTLGRERSACWLSRWLFLRLIGIIYLIAFVSLWGQIDGLVGHNGILPAADHFSAVGGPLGPGRYWR